MNLMIYSVIIMDNNQISINDVSSLVRDILLSQNLSEIQINQILNDQKYDLVSDDLDRILERLYKAKVLEEKVVIVGDYDADGIMATTILVKALKTFGIDAGFYIPDRLKEGYGLSESIVNLVSSKEYSLIITVDNGVVAYDALNLAKELGVDVIVTDHHSHDEVINYPFDYLLHPKFLSEGYNDLAGAGLALILAEKLLNKQNMGEYYVYAMVATIADMVSVFGFNRNIIKNGLYFINKNGNEYIEKLIHYRNGVIDQQAISFQVVPKLNTFGRLADQVNVNNMVRYFMLEDKGQIESVAKDITKLNQVRIDMTRTTFEKSTNIVKYGTLNILIDEDIHEGITGLIAGRHLNKINEPMLVLTKSDDVYKGSGRSPKGYDIHKLLSPLSSNFIAFGGHAQACGLSIHESELNSVLQLITNASKDLSIIEYEDVYLDVNVKDLTVEAVNEFSKLEPYGVDFIKPLLKVDAHAMDYPTVLKEKYLKWSIQDDIELLSFDGSQDLDYYKKQLDLSAYVNISLNTFRNKTTINLVVDKFID